MKKIRIFLSIAALLFAISGALAAKYAGQFNTHDLKGYEYVQDNVCDDKGFVCDTEGTEDCEITPGTILRSNNTTTTCGAPLSRIPD